MLTRFNESNDIVTTKIDGANTQFTISSTAQAAASAFWVFACSANATGYLSKPDASSVSATNISSSAAFRHLSNYFFGTNAYILDSYDKATQRTSIHVVQIGRPLLDEGIYPNTVTAVVNYAAGANINFSLTSYDIQNNASLNSPIGLSWTMVNVANTADVVGTVFYDHGVIIFHGGSGNSAAYLAGAGTGTFAFSILGGDGTAGSISGNTGGATANPISSSLNLVSFVCQSRNIVKRTIYFTRAFNRDYNFTTNPTARDSAGFIINSLTANPTTFITTVGLYDDSGNLLAVGKINPSKKKDQYAEALFKVQLDY